MKTSFYDLSINDPGAISIAARTHPDFTGPRYSALAPSRHLLTSIKRGYVSEEYFEKTYKKEVLENLDPKKVYDDLCNLVEAEPVLCCWCYPGEFCHRRVVARWLEENLNVVIEEKNEFAKEGKKR